MNKLEQEIEKIKHELAVTIPEELQNATDFTDSSESGEYSEILSRQNLLGIRLAQLMKRLHSTKHIDLKSIAKNKVGIGSLVKLLCKETKKVFLVKIVSTEISDTFDECLEEITISSPMGKALYDKLIHDEILVYTPAGIKQYSILELTTIHDLKT